MSAGLPARIEPVLPYSSAPGPGSLAACAAALGSMQCPAARPTPRTCSQHGPLCRAAHPGQPGVCPRLERRRTRHVWRHDKPDRPKDAASPGGQRLHALRYRVPLPADQLECECCLQFIKGCGQRAKCTCCLELLSKGSSLAEVHYHPVPSAATPLPALAVDANAAAGGHGPLSHLPAGPLCIQPQPLHCWQPAVDAPIRPLRLAR